ncbi:SDR family oxidoreductase [Microbacterium sp. ZXX196]|uniref:SDR family NAD(P)-dependent oxidoreductase n=1 Tax=Microbacterium sp. ZXX196 TaxID=2609291 RepID=UPI0012B8558B|nr:SDR family oxidoreductase [Microbacterium sp. ZXX196]MTE24264.1 SDR family NAD(P)-dependent oxidoreductase [Microbacterium sp. ZXX196]
MPSSSPTTLITGASAGLGAEFAAQLAARGHDLVLVARREERLRELADRLAADHGVLVETIAADLASDGAARRLHAETASRGIHVTGLVNNAGFGLKGALADEDPTRLDAMIHLNVATLTALTRAYLPDILAAGGILVNVASTAAYQPCPSMAAYGATKAYVLSFTEAIAHEARGSGARILAISPGATRTEFFDEVGTEAMAFGRFQSSRQVVAHTLRALDARSRPASVVSGRLNALTAAIAQRVPRRLALAASGRALR